uniref:Uncharacterized protein n=1 Tax=Anguilla anguilla TaxID=7936 RepID=A0A0E9UNB5_ANGAN
MCRLPPLALNRRFGDGLRSKWQTAGRRNRTYQRLVPLPVIIKSQGWAL